MATTALFKIPYTTHPGQTLFVVGGTPELGSWDHAEAVGLNWDDHVWSVAVTTSPKFEYKYLVKEQDTCTWEQGLNRTADLLTLQDGLLEDYWESYRFDFYVHAPIDSATKRLHITGSPAQLGAWRDFRPLDLDSELRRLRTGELKRCWKASVIMSKFDNLQGFEYRYLEIDLQTGSAVWEREPSRKAVYKADVSSLVNSRFEVLDDNFVVTFNFFKIATYPVYIGPFPQQRADVEALAREGVTAVLDLQTEGDSVYRRINTEELAQAYADLGILHMKCPIEDFNEVSLRDNLRTADEKLSTLHSQGHSVYVHCTAGTGRAPAVVIAYLKLTLGLSYQEARNIVYKSRPFAAPNERVLKEVLA
jgi:protein-tyrosine phosphatase